MEIKKTKKPWVPESKSGFNKKHQTSDSRYHTQRWRNYRNVFLKHHPLCVNCGKVGKIHPSETVDHIIPISQDDSDHNFWNPGNHQALCKRCNLSKAAKEK